MDKVDKEDKYDLGVYIPSVKSALSQNEIVDHWQKWLLS